GPDGGRPASKNPLPPPITQFETQGSAMPEIPQETGGPGQAGQEQPPKGGLLARLLGGRGKEHRQGKEHRRGKAEDHYDFATPGRVASPDELRTLPTSFRRVGVSPELEANRAYLQQAFGDSWDVVYRDLVIGDVERPALLVFVDGLVDKEAIHRFAIFALTIEARTAGLGPPGGQHRLLDVLQSKVIGFGELRLSADVAEIADRLVGGETAVFVAGETAAIVMDTRGWRDRGIQEPATEVTVRGPRDGFNETLKTSTALLRRRLKTPLLRLERTMVGDYTRTDIVVAYIAGLANAEVVREVRRRLNRISIDGFLESSYIEELIQDDPATFFPLVRATEYPDRGAAALLEGNVAIMADTTPFSLLVPATFVSMLQAAEDHFERPAVSTAVRLVRVFCLFFAIYGSALYVAATSFHPEILPLPLLERLVAAKIGVPFGSALEALILEVAFEILREAGVRLPRVIGQAVSIVGALVLGESAVTAGIVSPAIVIVVALSAICSLALPSYFLTLGMRLLRFPLILLSGALGIFGLSMGSVVLIAHLASLKSFGVPYLAALAPFNLASWRRDVIIRAPRWAHDRRPSVYGAQEPERTAGYLRPGPGQPNQPSAAQGSGGSRTRRRRR
ncbi:MAG: spore germination protein, partial [Bacillota bacterium]|nr:spore germination protein [Bacillota bacterium]